MKRIAVCLVFAVLYLLFPSVVQADSTLLWKDTFDSDLLWWKEVLNSQHVQTDLPCLGQNERRAEWSVDSGSAFLRIGISPACSVVMVPTREDIASLPAFSVGFTMRISSVDQDRNWMLRWKDEDNFLAFHIFRSGIYPEKVVNGQGYEFGEPIAFSFQGGRTYAIRLEYEEELGQTRLFINETPIAHFLERESDPRLTEGKPGLAGSVGFGIPSSTTWYDDFSVWELGGEENLAVPALQQNDPRWGHLEYDRASVWSPAQSNITDWGCALVSAVMVLRFHGITYLHTGEELRPDTVNTWLQQQPDGYWGEGNLNWRALTRLTWLAYEAYGTTKLEFSYVSPEEGEKRPWVRQQLQEGRPVILEQPGHFVVARGYTRGTGQILLHDPFYPRTTLGAYQETYRSARLFTPSQTDLSAITVISPVDPRLRFFLPDGTEVFPDQTWEEQPVQNATTREEAGRAYRVYEFVQPNDRELVVRAELPDERLYPVQIFAYQRDGSVTAKKWMLSENEHSAEIQIEYKKDAPTQFHGVEGNETPGELTRNHVAAWLGTEELRSPLLAEKILEWQTAFLDSTNLEQAQAQFRLTQMLLLAAQQNGWVRPWVSSLLLDVFQGIIQEKYP